MDATILLPYSARLFVAYLFLRTILPYRSSFSAGDTGSRRDRQRHSSLRSRGCRRRALEVPSTRMNEAQPLNIIIFQTCIEFPIRIRLQPCNWREIMTTSAVDSSICLTTYKLDPFIDSWVGTANDHVAEQHPIRWPDQLFGKAVNTLGGELRSSQERRRVRCCGRRCRFESTKRTNQGTSTNTFCCIEVCIAFNSGEIEQNNNCIFTTEENPQYSGDEGSEGCVESLDGVRTGR